MKIMLAAASLLALTATASAASAQDIAFNVGVTSDYVFRGYTQTNEDPALQAGADISVGSWYGGIWASNVDFGDDTDIEVDIYGGYKTEVAGFAVDLGVVGYGYLNAPAGADYDYLEAKVAVSRAFGPVTLGVASYISPDFFGVDEEAVYAEANAAFSPAAGWTVTGAYGQQSLDVNDDYTTWNAGVVWAFTDSLAFDVRYHDTDVDGPLSDDRAVVSVKYLF